MERGSSPEEATALLAAAETVTGLVLDSDADVDGDAFVKENSSSPVADNGSPSDGGSATMRMQRLKFKPASPTQPLAGIGMADAKAKGLAARQQGTKPSRPSGRGPAASKGVRSRAPQAPGDAIVPRKVEDWEPWKGILYQLYITQNRILREIIGIMETKYNVLATPKMYKNQFARWGFFKYAVKRRARIQAESPLDQSSDDSLDSPDSLDGIIMLTRDAVMHENTGSRGRQVGLTAVRRFLLGHIDHDAGNLKAEEVAGFVDPCYRYFKVAMDLFDIDENLQGGQVLRLAFLQIERKMSNPTMKSFSDLCFLVPHLLLESGRQDILAAYLRYVAGLAAVKFGKHPIAELAATFAGMVDERPEDIMRYIMLLSQAHADLIASQPGMLDRNREWARNQYLACQRTVTNSYSNNSNHHFIMDDPWSSNGGGGFGGGGGNSPPAFTSPRTNTTTTTTTTSSSTALARPHDHHMIRLEAQSVYWAQKLVMQDPESDAMGQQWLRRAFADDFGPRCEAYLATVQARVADGTFPVVFARMMETLYVGWLYDYYETVGEWDQAFMWGRRGLELSSDEQFTIWSIHLEDLMRRHGRPEEAEELMRKRRAHAWVEKVRLEVDRLTLV